MTDKAQALLDKYYRVMGKWQTLTAVEASELVADDCIIHEAKSLPFGGPWKGPQGIVDLMATVQRTFHPFEFEMRKMSASDDVVAFLGQISGEGGKGRFSIPIVEFWIFRDGKAVEIYPMWHDTKLVMDVYRGDETKDRKSK